MQDNTEPSHRSMEGVTTSEESIKEILYGTLLGDGYIFGNDRYTKRFGFFQSEEKKEYVEYLAKLLETRFKKINILKKNAKERWNAKIQYGFQIGDKYFNHLQKVFYKRKRKRVTQKILSSLTPLSLALWWMDDGSLTLVNRKYKDRIRAGNGGRRLTLCTHSFNLKEHKIIQKYFIDRWNIHWIIKKDCGCYCLYSGINEGIKFLEIIFPYIIPCMFYKIYLNYSDKNSRSPHKARHDKIMKIWSELYGDIQS